MKTSYYQNPRLRADQAAGTVQVVQTSNGSPRWGARPDWHLDSVMPPAELVAAASAGQIDATAFAIAYRRHLDANASEIITAIRDLVAEVAPAEVALCCFEALKRPGQFCHRTTLAAWWQERTTERVQEL